MRVSAAAICLMSKLIHYVYNIQSDRLWSIHILYSSSTQMLASRAAAGASCMAERAILNMLYRDTITLQAWNKWSRLKIQEYNMMEYLKKKRKRGRIKQLLLSYIYTDNGRNRNQPNKCIWSCQWTMMCLCCDAILIWRRAWPTSYSVSRSISKVLGALIFIMIAQPAPSTWI
jgi:hypothetical protein